MAPGGKNPLRDKLEEDVLDLSLMQLEEVPVNEIAQLTKGTTLDLSNNLLTYLPDNFPLLSHLVKLDLSKNQISELPEYFGQLRSLKHLDLYSNKLTRLPVGFCHLKSLKWLDLKGNPLVPALAKAAGPCITASDCAKCAKQVVVLMQSMSSQLDRERQKHLLEEQKAEAKRRAEEEAERERIRMEKKAAKEKRREEAMMRDGGGAGGRDDRNKKRFADSMSEVRHEMEKPPTQRSTPGAFGNQANGSARNRGSGGSGRGWCASLFMMLMGIAFVTLASGISMLWIYTGGHLDQKSIDRALPMMQKDVDTTMLMMGNKLEVYWKETNKALGPYAAQARVKAGEGWVEFKRRSDLTAYWINTNLGPAFCQLKASTREYWILAQSKISEGWALLKPKIWELWSQLKPYLVQFAMYVSEVLTLALDWIKKNGPIYGQLVLDTIYHTVVTVGQTVDGWING